MVKDERRKKTELLHLLRGKKSSMLLYTAVHDTLVNKRTLVTKKTMTEKYTGGNEYVVHGEGSTL